MTSGLGPVAEGIFALDAFGARRDPAGYRDPVLAKWRRSTALRLGDRLGDVRSLVQERRPVPDLLWLLGRRSRPVAAGGGEDVVFAFCRVAVLPHWSRVQSTLESERERRGRRAIVDGVESVLASLSPRLRWNPPVLEVLDAPDGEIGLGGRGMLLCPSAFLLDGPLVIPRERETGLPAVIFPIQSGAYALAHSADDWEPSEQVLAALIGATRSAALFALTESCTTGVLAQRLGISLAGASKHATVLRKAGLVTTTRTRNTALHTLTSLGVALLQRELVGASTGDVARVV
ncbi:ArsR/SmtB family transcription factor [Umezawaea beigongshangensis]|uniref:ArsR/SmtB family transcription factor n=1 Tax=Umezawaea beigongshangensis TaxID=2780383 RepID=UPI0018F246E5|nr:winged helix-turn-helix domain-containing protein [Umezawaea beigongshangensis]